MEEFSNNNTSGGAMLPQQSKVTLEPMHEGVAPAGESDAQIVARHASGPAIGNIASDTEITGNQPDNRTEAEQRAALAIATHRPQRINAPKIKLIVVGATSAIFIALLAYVLLVSTVLKH